MARDLQCLYLHIAQLQIEGTKALGRSYHSHKVADLIKENNKLIEHFLSSYDESIIASNIDLFYSVLSFLGYCHSYIVSSTSEDVNNEIYSCLRYVLKDWIPDADKYVILCAQGEYALHAYKLNNIDFYDLIESAFNFKYGIRMIPITMPFHTQGDYMFNAALYHEIGHFIDNYHKISACILEDVRNGKLVIPQADVYLKDMTEDLGKDKDKYYQQLSHFLKEYLADLFAAKYTKKSIFHYLKYINPFGKADPEHPSIGCREKIVDEFLDDPANYSDFLRLLISHTKDMNGDILNPNTQNIDISSFVNLVECDKPSSEQHVHSIIPNLWDIWNNKRDEFKDNAGVPMHYIEIYRNLMDLTAKTIQKLQ